MGFLVYFGIALATMVAYLWVKAAKINQHWKNHGVPGPQPLLFFGNLLPVLLYKKSLGQIFKEIYDAYPNEKVVGYYHFMQPRLLVRDKKLIERIFIKDFQHFTSRFGSADIFNDPLNANLFSLSGNVWKAVRAKFAPMFTTVKLRNMYPNIGSIGDNFLDLLEKNTRNVDLQEKTKTYAIEVISLTAFGIEPGPMIEENNEFRTRSREVMPTNFLQFIRFNVFFVVPTIAAKLGINFASQDTIKYFTDIVKTTLWHRKRTGSSRNDFVQQMVILQEKGEIEVENNYCEDEYLKLDDVPDLKINTSDDMMAGQAFALLAAGFEVTAISLLFMVYDLAVHLEHQEKARAEIKQIFEAHGRRISSDSLKEMKYLDACMKESLRVNSPIVMLMRSCTKTYEIPEINYTVSIGENVVVPPLAIHLDSENYPQPEKFDPQRWLGDLKYVGPTYLPWGLGPRVCIGMRFAEQELKSVLAKMLLHYEVSLHPSTKPSYTPKAISFFNEPTAKILINLEKISNPL